MEGQAILHSWMAHPTKPDDLMLSVQMSDMEGAAEVEYRACRARFWSMIKSGAPPSEVTDDLGEIEIEREGIELGTGDDHRRDIAVKAAALAAAWRLPARP